MTVSFTDRIVDGVDKLLLLVRNSVLRSNPEQFIDLVGTDDDTTFTSKDGSLITVLALRGTTSRLYPSEMKGVVVELAEIIGRDLLKEGDHSISISFEFDPDEALNYAKRALAGTRQTARKLGLSELTDVMIEEKSQKMAQYCQVEKTYMAVVTGPQSIDNRDRKDEVKRRAEEVRQWPAVAESMLNGFAFPQMRTKHKAAVKSLVERIKTLQSMGNGGVLVDFVSVREYLKQCRQVTHPGTSNRWTPRVSDDAGQDIRLPETVADLKGNTEDFKMPPTISQQLFSSVPESIGTKYAVMGNRIYYPVTMTLGPNDPKSFDEFLATASGLRVPFRINMTLKAHGLGVGYLNTMLADIFSWTSTGNTQIKRANEALESYVSKSGGVVPAMTITACTWAPVRATGKKDGDIEYDLSEIEDRGVKLHRALQSWGGCQTGDAFAAPIEGTLATQAGLLDQTMGRVMAPPMPDAVGMSPVFRETTSWDVSEGNILMRTDTGRFLHYQQTSSRQNAWVTLLVGPMGFSKSTTMNTLNLYYLITPSAESELPYLRMLDVGPSSRSIIDAVQSSVPTEQKHLAQYVRMQNTSDYQINPFDTPLGLEFPLGQHKQYLTNLISAVCFSMATNEKTQGRLPGLVTAIVDATYEMYASQANGGDRARVFSRNANPLVTEKVDQYGIETDDVTSWHEVRDALMEVGEIRAALIAHRKAMPILADLIGVASSPHIRETYPDDVDGVGLLDLFTRSIQEAVSMFEILNGETRFELGEAKIISLDVEDMVPKDSSDRSLWQASIAFLIAYNVLTKDFFFHRDDLVAVPKRYYAYHERKVKALEGARKRFSMDERQRFSAISAAQTQVDSLIAEGRKNKIDIMVASQLFKDHTEKSIELSTSIFILGAGNITEKEATDIQSRFQINSSQMQAIRGIKAPSPRGAEAFIIFRTRDGEQRHSVLLTEGPVYLWLIATEADDRVIRSRMYERFPRGEALQRLAARFPGGSIKKDLEARLAQMNDEESEIDGRANDRLVEDLVEECANLNLD